MWEGHVLSSDLAAVDEIFDGHLVKQMTYLGPLTCSAQLEGPL